jgi:hypothetical protein
MKKNKVVIKDSTLEKSPIIVDSPGATVNITEDTTIHSLTAEVKLIVTLKSLSNAPPSEMDFLPVGGGKAYLFGSQDARIPLSFISPVLFQKQADGKLAVVNRYSLVPDSPLQNKRIDYLLQCLTLQVPIITIVYGQMLSQIKGIKISLYVNGKLLWAQENDKDTPFQEGPVITYDLANLHQTIQYLKKAGN